MARRVVLHIGLMKSGTSYLQNLVFSQRQQLASAGVLVPGNSRSHHDPLRQGRTVGGPRDLWEPVLDEIQGHDGDVVLSSELLAGGVHKLATNLLPELAPTPVEIIVTVRDLNRSLVSMWQETMQNGRAWTWDDYYSSVRETAPCARTGDIDFSTAGGRFWKQQDVGFIVGKLADRLGAGQVTVVTVPPRGADRTVLPARFAEATGIPLDPSLRSPWSNDSLGLASALVLRELNQLLDAKGHSWPEGIVVRKRVLAKKALARLADTEPKLGLDLHDWVREQTAASVEAIEATEIRLVGAWSDLDPLPVPGVQPEDVDPALIARAAVAGLAAVIAHHPEIAR